MQVLITGKKLEVGDSLRNQAGDRVRDVCKKYDLTPLEMAVTFSKEGSPFHAMIRCDLEMHLGKGIYVRAHGETDDAHVSLASAFETFEKRLARYKGKLMDHKKKRDLSSTEIPGSQYIINPQGEKGMVEDNPLIVAELTHDIPTLTVSEAVMHLDLSDTQAILFNNVKNNQLNVVYWRSDGNIGWISPSQNS